MKIFLSLSLLLLTLTQTATAQTMEDYFSPKYQYPEVDLRIAKDYTFIVPQQTTYQKGNCLSYQPKSISGNFTLLLDKSAIVEFAKNYDKESYAFLQENVDFNSLDKFGCQKFKPTTDDNQYTLDELFQNAISAGKTTILNETGDIVPQVTIIYGAYYQMGEIFYKIDDEIFWQRSWYIS